VLIFIGQEHLHPSERPGWLVGPAGVLARRREGGREGGRKGGIRTSELI